MSRLSVEFQLQAPLEQAAQLCQQAIQNLPRWKLQEVEPNRIVAKLDAKLFSAQGPISIELLLEPSESTTSAQLNAHNWQGGPVGKHELDQALGHVRGAIETAAGHEG